MENTSAPKTKAAEEKGIRTFESGATRGAGGILKLDYEGFLSPLVLKRFGEYMNRHRVQPDGTVRGSDNWQMGIPQEEYLKSLIRHVVDVWMIMDGFEAIDPETGEKVSLEDAACGVIFNGNGILFEELMQKREEKGDA